MAQLVKRDACLDLAVGWVLLLGVAWCCRCVQLVVLEVGKKEKENRAKFENQSRTPPKPFF